MNRMKLANEAKDIFLDKLKKKKSLTVGEKSIKESLERTNEKDGKVLFRENSGFVNKLSMSDF